MKPDNCRNCPASKVNKNGVYCFCSRTLAINDNEEKKLYKNCLLDW